MQILLAIFLIFFFCFILYKASESLIHSLKVLADSGLLSKFLLASIFGGVATSLPEVFVGISSAIEKKPEIALGNALGSNIVDLAIVVPLVILISGKALLIHKEDFTFKNVFLIFTSSLLPFLLAIDGAISRIDGLFLVFMFFIYTFYLFPKRKQEVGIFNFLKRFNDGLHKKKTLKTIALMTISIIILLFASEGLVRSASFISQALNIKLFLIGVFLVAAGTSLPELFISISAIKNKDQTIFFGDIFGSLITNANLVIGISTMINPIQIQFLNGFRASIITLFLVFILFVLFSYTKKIFDRREALIMICVYIIFFIIESF